MAKNKKSITIKVKDLPSTGKSYDGKFGSNIKIKEAKKPFLLKKPPLGLRPAFLYEEERIIHTLTVDKCRLTEINQAKARYRKAKVKPPKDWTTQARKVRRRIKRLAKKWNAIRQASARLNPNRLES